MKIRLLVCTLFTLTYALNAQTVTWFEPGDNGRQEQQVDYSGPETGFATYYAAYLAGQPTAYGEVYRPNQLTASHANLPLGTILKVTRLDNSASVNVRVNDRGGLCAGCVVVLSKQAADAIGLDQTGRSRVRIEKVGFSNWNPNSNSTQGNTRVATNQTVNPPAPATYSNRVAVRSVEVDEPMAWEEDLRRSGAPSPVEDPYAYQPASYRNMSATPVANSTSTSSNPYAQNNNVVAPNTYTIPITQGSQANTQQNMGTIQPSTTRTTVPVPSTYSSPPPAAPTNAVIRPQATTQQNTAVLSPPRAPSAPTATENPLSNRELSPNSVSLRARTPATNQSNEPAPVYYTTNPTTTGQLTNRTVLPPTTASASSTYAVQIGAYSTRINADRMAESLRDRGFSDVRVLEGNSGSNVINRVVLGNYDSGSTAQLAADQLKAAHDLTAVVVAL
ncbi:MAG: septal ring lytic transglycosylase RlpA family protein [Bacteroidota bacterium]